MDTKNAKAIALYAILAKFADWSTMEAHPSVATLAKLMGYSSRKAVDEALAVLTEQGWVEVFPRWVVEGGDGESSVVYEQPEGKGWRQTSNGYVLNDHPTKGGTPSPIGNPPPAPEGTHPPSLEGTLPLPYREHEQEPNKQEPVKREPMINAQAELALPAPDTSGFTEWYEAYPRHVGKKAAEKAYKAARRAGVTHDDLMGGLARSARSWAVEGRSKDKMPYPATWLNQGRWDDEETVAADMAQRQESAMDVADRMIAQMRQGTGWDEWKEIER